METVCSLDDDEEEMKEICHSDHIKNMPFVKSTISCSLKNYILDPLQDLINGYLFNIVLLKSTKDNKSVECYIPYLQFQSKTMHMKLESNDFYYLFDYSYDVIQCIVQYVHSHGFHKAPKVEKPLKSDDMAQNTTCMFDF
jgi:hypothetical protein